MRIVVTPRDIVQAAIDSHDTPVYMCCPVAQSMKRRGFEFVQVSQESIRYRHNGQFRHVNTPPVAAEWIERYDAHHHVGPFSFELPGVTV